MAVLSLGGCGGASTPEARGAARVQRVVDGDTLVLSGIGRVRLIGVDTPEVYGQQECFGGEASAFVERLLPPGQRVSYRIGAEPRDRYGRALAYVYVEHGRMLNALLVGKGYATPLTIPPNVGFAARFRELARRAREREAGLWSPGACGGAGSGG